MRAYENGKPAVTPHYLKWSAEGVRENDLVFAAGNPGTTSRLATQAQFAFHQNVQLPIVLARLMSRIEILRAYGAESPQNKRAQQTLFGLANSYKSSAGKLLGLKDEHLSLRRKQFEKRLRKAVENDPKLGMEAAKSVGRRSRRVQTVDAEREGVPGAGAAGGAGLVAVPARAYPGTAGR